MGSSVSQKKVETINGTLPRMDGDIDSGICGGANDLILYLQEQQQQGRLSFIAIYHEIDSTSFVTINMADEKRYKKNSSNNYLKGLPSAQQQTESELPNGISISTHSTPAPGRLFEMFPEIFMLDVTHATNIVARPLAVCASIAANMETFTPMRAFLSSECQWVLH